MIFRYLSPGGGRAKLSIFIFHRVLPAPDPYVPHDPDVWRFDRIVRFLSRAFRVLPLSHALRRLREGSLPAGSACITFDDGYADNHELAAPILRRHGACATFFISTSFIDGGRMWNDTVTEAVRALPDGLVDWRDLGLGSFVLEDEISRVRACHLMLEQLKYKPALEREAVVTEIGRRAELADRSSLMMSRRQVFGLAEQGMEIGAHSLTHPILASVGESAAREEIGGSREVLGQWLGEPPALFAYPNGLPGRDYGERDVRLVRAAGFEGAVTTAAGHARAGDDLLQLPRFTPWDRDMLRFGLRCALNLRVRPRTVASTESKVAT